MFRNYFKTAWRNLLKNKSFTFINISGLAIGMASAMLIFLWIENQLSHDRFHEKGDRIYVANNRDSFDGQLWAWNSTPKILGPTLKSDYPEVEETVRVNNASFLFTVGNRKFNVEGGFTDPGFFNVFSFPLKEGRASDALNEINRIVITEKFAKRLFGETDAMGKTVRIDSTDHFVVSGILKDLPNNTIFNFEYLLPWSYMKKIGWDDDSWTNNSIRTFILLKSGISQQTFDAKIRNITIDHTANTDKSTTEVFTQRFGDSWLYSRAENGKYTDGRIERVRLFSVIAVFILLVACINFMNLSTARSEKRAREVGVRKVVGAPRRALIAQFIGESVLLSSIAGMFAVIVVRFCLPWYNQLVNTELFIAWDKPLLWLVFLAFILVTGIAAGSYPAFFLSSFRPVNVLKGVFRSPNAVINPRRVLVVLQFTFAITLIIGTIVVRRQISYALSRDTGYSRDQLVFTHLQGDAEKNYYLIRNELLRSGAAVSVTKTMNPITQRYSDSWGFSWPGSTEKDAKVDFLRMSSDAGFTRTMGISLVAGRDIDVYNYPTDSTAVLLNEAAVQVMRLKDPVGQVVKEEGKDWHIAGVIKDFILESPYAKVNPLMVFGPDSWFNVVHYKLNPDRSVADNLRLAEQVFKKYNPQYPFVANFADESYALKFREEQRTGTLTTLFAGLTIFISCLGLFGLAAYMAGNRIKEIGVRKVLGASVLNIASLLSLDFLKLVMLSFVIAAPVAWYAMSRWLKHYEYRVEIEWWVFALTGLLAMLIAAATVGYQAVRAAVANPVKSLRTE